MPFELETAAYANRASSRRARAEGPARRDRRGRPACAARAIVRYSPRRSAPGRSSCHGKARRALPEPRASSTHRARSTAGSTASGTTGRSAARCAQRQGAWWQRMVRERDDVVGLDTSIIANPQTWVASGHVENFHDPMVDCRRLCKRRFRADQIDPDDRCSASEDGRTT